MCWLGQQESTTRLSFMTPSLLTSSDCEWSQNTYFIHLLYLNILYHWSLTEVTQMLDLNLSRKCYCPTYNVTSLSPMLWIRSRHTMGETNAFWYNKYLSFDYSSLIVACRTATMFFETVSSLMLIIRQWAAYWPVSVINSYILIESICYFSWMLSLLKYL